MRIMLYSCKCKGKIDERKKNTFFPIKMRKKLLTIEYCVCTLDRVKRLYYPNGAIFQMIDLIGFGCIIFCILLLDCMCLRFWLHFYFLFFIFLLLLRTDFSLQFFFDNEEDTNTFNHLKAIALYPCRRRFFEEGVMYPFIFTNNLHNEIWWRHRQWRRQLLANGN